jgi:serine phosphatase RsbU (regulator of sigma subunit)
MATLCLLDIEPGTGATRLANAGHPPPLLVVDGRARYLTHHTPLLGVPGPPATEATFAMEPGGVLVLFTDGLVERRGRSVDDGLALLAEAAATVDEDLERFCDRLLAEVGPPEPEDDIAIVALRRA